jgi:hypothetical protein
MLGYEDQVTFSLTGITGTGCRPGVRTLISLFQEAFPMFCASYYEFVLVLSQKCDSRHASSCVPPRGVRNKNAGCSP